MEIDRSRWPCQGEIMIGFDPRTQVVMRGGRGLVTQGTIALCEYVRFYSIFERAGGPTVTFRGSFPGWDIRDLIGDELNP